MATFSDVLKSEILRISRKASREPLASLHSASTRHRKQLAQLTRELAALRKEVSLLRRETARRGAADAPVSAPAEKTRFQARGLKSLRARLGLSADDFGRLIGVSGLTIYNWEHGKSVPRPDSLARLAELRSVGKREAAARLASSK